MKVTGEWCIFARTEGVDRRGRPSLESSVFRSKSESVARRKLARLNAGHVPPATQRVSTEPARRHIAWLQAQGVGVKTLAPHVSITYNVLRRIASGEAKRTSRENLAAILAIKPQAVIAEGARVKSDASFVLIERLVAAGYRRGWIAKQLGTIGRALQVARTPYIMVKTARAIREIYRVAAETDPRLAPLGSFQFQLDVPEPTTKRSGRSRVASVEQPEVPHGTRSRYESGCRCKECVAVASEYERAEKSARRLRFVLKTKEGMWQVTDRKTGAVVFEAAERSTAVDTAGALNAGDPIAAANTPVAAEPAREHVRALMSAGFSARDVADRAGVAVEIVYDLVRTRRTRIRHRFATAILAVQVTDIRSSSARVDARPTWDLLDRLDAGGFRAEWVAEVVNLSTNTLRDRPKRIRLEDARAVQALYSTIRDRMPIVREIESKIGA